MDTDSEPSADVLVGARSDEHLGDLSETDDSLWEDCIWVRGGLTVTGLQREFNDPGWELRGQYRATLQFIMNWNNWPSYEDRCAMLDGPPQDDMPQDQKARIAAIVHTLCDRDNHPIPDWVHGVRTRHRAGVYLTGDTPVRNCLGFLNGYARMIRRNTPRIPRLHRVWLEEESLNKR